MDVQQLNELSYKELQGKAKQYSIPANQKKEILIAEIVALEDGSENSENAPILANKPIMMPTTPSAKISTRVTRSTVKKAQVKREDTEIESLTEQVESLKVEPIIEVAEVIEASPMREVVAPIETVAESPMASEDLISSIPTPCEEAFEETEEDEEYFEAEETEFPTPTKLFENNEPFEYNEQGQKIHINRHVYFTSPDGKGSVVEVADQGQKHMHFASPELQMGKGVHWRYEDYNGTEEVAEEESEEQEQEQDAESVVTESSEINSKNDRMKLPTNHNDRVMSFWLTKAFANPIGNFFK